MERKVSDQNANSTNDMCVDFFNFDRRICEYNLAIQQSFFEYCKPLIGMAISNLSVLGVLHDREEEREKTKIFSFSIPLVIENQPEFSKRVADSVIRNCLKLMDEFGKFFLLETCIVKKKIILLS